MRTFQVARRSTGGYLYGAQVNLLMNFKPTATKPDKSHCNLKEDKILNMKHSGESTHLQNSDKDVFENRKISEQHDGLIELKTDTKTLKCRKTVRNEKMSQI